MIVDSEAIVSLTSGVYTLVGGGSQINLDRAIP